MAVSKEEFRRALGQFASSVTVVTVKLADNRLAGITVTAFSSLSLEPPLVLVCIDKRAFLQDRLQTGTYFAVNMLAEGQDELSRRFASREPEKFAGIEYIEGVDGSPLLKGAVAAIECRVVDRLPGGDHTIVVGQVEHATVTDEQPLVYFRGGYRKLGSTDWGIGSRG